MNSRQRGYLRSLTRRRDRLTERLTEWDHGDPAPTRRELKALVFAIRVVEEAERHGMLDDLGGTR